MCFTGKSLKTDHTLTLTINGNILKFVHTAKYLGVIVTIDCSSNSDIAQQLSGIYCRSNMLIQNSWPVQQILKSNFPIILL